MSDEYTSDDRSEVTPTLEYTFDGGRYGEGELLEDKDGTLYPTFAEYFNGEGGLEPNSTYDPEIEPTISLEPVAARTISPPDDWALQELADAASAEASVDYDEPSYETPSYDVPVIDTPVIDVWDASSFDAGVADTTWDYSSGSTDWGSDSYE